MKRLAIFGAVLSVSFTLVAVASEDDRQRTSTANLQLKIPAEHPRPDPRFHA